MHLLVLLSIFIKFFDFHLESWLLNLMLRVQVVHQTPQVSGGLELDVDVQTALTDVAFLPLNVVTY